METQDAVVLNSTTVGDDQLVGALNLYDVPFLTGGLCDDAARALTPDAILEGLARSAEARVRSAIIPFLLRHPEFVDGAKMAAERLPLGQPAGITLACFYTAALFLQKKYEERLVRLFGVQPMLMDLFSGELDLASGGNVETALKLLGERNAALGGLTLNWVGTYEHAARTWLEYVEWRVQREKAIWQAN
jgi:hypothetical protein